RQGRWIVKERQEILAEARRECERLLLDAREQAVAEASQAQVSRIAERQAAEILAQAKRRARETRLEVDDWADGILSSLELNLEKFLAAVVRGRERLHERSSEEALARSAEGSDLPRQAA